MPQVRTCEYFEKKLLFLNIKSVTGTDLWKREKMLEYIKYATGPDLWIFWEKTFIFKYATGPDLWIFWEKTFIFKYQKFDRSGPVEYKMYFETFIYKIKSATGCYFEKNFYF